MNALEAAESAEEKKMSPKVTLPNGKEIYKATLVSMLNEDPGLTRVRQK